MIVCLSKAKSGHSSGGETTPNKTERKGIIITNENKEKKTYKALERMFKNTSFL